MKLWLASIMTSCDGLWEDTDGWYHSPSSRVSISSCFPTPPFSVSTFLYPPSDTLNVHGSVKATCISHFSHIETDPAFKLQTDTKCGDSGGLDTHSLYSHWIGQCLVYTASDWPMLASSHVLVLLNPHSLLLSEAETIVQQLWVLQKCYKSLILDLNGPDMIIIF